MAADEGPPPTTPNKAEAITPLTFDDETASLLEQLHRAWATRAPASTYVAIRDAILRQREHVDTRILTLTTVARLACPRALHGEVDMDPQWHELLALADSANTRPRRDWDDKDDGRTKTGKGSSRSRMYNESNRLRNLAIVAALWSPSLVEYYGWNTSTQVQMNMLRACAIRYPWFDQDFRPRLNRVLITRHCLSLRNSRCKSLSEAPLQPHRDFDLAALAAAVPDEALESQWVSNQDGRIPVDIHGTLLRDLRPVHFRMHLLCHDRYNLLVSRGDVDGPLSQISSVDHAALISAVPSIVSVPDMHHDSPYNMAESSSGSLRQATSAASTSPQATSSDMQFDTPLTDQSYDQACAYEQFDMDADFTLDADATLNDCGIQILPWERSDSEVRTQLDILLDEHSFVRTCDYGQVVPSSSSDFQIDAPAYLPAFDSSSWTQMDWEGFMEHSLPHPSPAVARSPFESLPQSSQEVRNISSNRHLTISSPPCLEEITPTYEEVLHTRHRSLISTYTESVFAQAQQPGAMERNLSRARWLSAGTEWASVWTHPDSQLPAGRAQSCDDADIMVIRSNELIVALSQGHVFQRPIVVKEAFSDSGLHSLDIFARSLREILPDTHSNPCGVATDQTNETSIDSILESMCRHDGDGELGCTFILRAITRSHQPLLTLLPRFRLLDNLIEKLRGADLLKPVTVSIPSWARSNALSLQGAFTGAQLNATGGMWMRNLSGIHFWTFVPQDNMKAPGWSDHGISSDRWAPRGQQKFFVLEQDDVLLIPPGLCVVHALHSPTNVLSDGGVLWDSMNLVQTLDSIYWMLKRQADRNDVWNHLPQLLVELECLVKHHIDDFAGERSKGEFANAFREAISRLRQLGATYGNPPHE